MSTAFSMSEVASRCAGDRFWATANQIAEMGGTPFYVYLPDRAAIAYHDFSVALKQWGRGHVAFSLKTNPMFGLLQDLRGWGSLIEVVSAWELSHARSVGFSSDQIVFNGPLKTEAELRQVIQSPPFTINVDSLDELGLLERVGFGSPHPLEIGLRLCPPKASGSWSRFGLEMSTGELDEAVHRIERSPFLVLKCVHFHLGTQIEDTNRYASMLSFVGDFWSRHSLGPDVWLDIGGGFPYDHSVPLEDQPFSPLLFFETIADAWSAALRPPLLTEPGRFIAAPSMAIVSRVLSRKPRSGEPTIVVLDSGTNHNVMAAFYEHLWSCADAAQPACRYRFCGPLCMEDDILSGEKLASLPSAGSLVAVFNSGAYSLALSRTFIQPRPAVFALRADGSHKLLVPAESAEQAYGFAFRMEHPRIDGRTGTRSGDEASG